jgi:ABC-type dipeptide/oligopeptide/nickel transport system permease subunit
MISPKQNKSETGGAPLAEVQGKDDELLAAEIEAEAQQTSMITDIWHRLKKHRLAMAGLAIIVVLILTAIFANVIAPYSYRDQNLDQALLSPSRDHLFGTDQFGRDLFSRIIYGSRISIAVAFLPVIVSVGIGVLLGAISGYYGGWIDLLIMRLADIMFAFPSLLFAIAIIFAIGRGILSLFIALALVDWAGDARLIRGQVLSIRSKEYVEAARAIGMSDRRIILRHVLPNCLAPIIVTVSMSIPGVILTEASLSFIGLGVQPPTPSWGAILNDGQRFIGNAPWMAFFPGAAIFLTVLAYNFLGDGLRDAMDPFLKN